MTFVFSMYNVKKSDWSFNLQKWISWRRMLIDITWFQFDACNNKQKRVISKKEGYKKPVLYVVVTTILTYLGNFFGMSEIGSTPLSLTISLFEFFLPGKKQYIYSIKVVHVVETSTKPIGHKWTNHSP